MSSPATSRRASASTSRTPAAALAADVQAAPAVVGGTGRCRAVGDVAVEGERQVDEGVLQPLAHPHGHDLHRRGVAVEPAVALGGAAALAHWARSQSSSAGRPSRSRCAVSCSTCARWREVGHVALAARPAEHPAAQPGRPGRLEARAATPRSRAWSAHSRSVSATRSVSASPPAARLGAVSPKNIVVAAARTSPLRCGCSKASSRHSQSSAAGEAKTSVSPV